MRSRATLFGHPIHQMLIVFPLGLLSMAFIFDVVRLVTGQPLGYASFVMIAAGILSGLVAAVVGLVDWTGIPRGTRARSIATLHGIGNVLVLVAFAGSWLARQPLPEDPPLLAVLLAGAGVAGAAITGWLGGELINRLGVGVDEGANLNAPSSLTHPSATVDQARRAV